jgi:DHA1 family bicyclomycin/chloramphenicol resistance-like MFS transporter
LVPIGARVDLGHVRFRGSKLIESLPLKRKNGWIIFLLGALSVITPFAVDMYLPAFSAIAAQFKTTTPAISLTLSTYFSGFALGQLLYGPLLDRFGRKRPLYVGLTVYILASIGCALAPNLRIFVALRFIEAIGGCVAQVGAIAMVRDFFPVEESARIFSMLFLMIGVSPLAAPTIGTTIMLGLGWQWIFALLATIATVTLALTFFMLPEGHQPDHSVSLRPEHIIRGFWNIFKNWQFLTYSMAGALSFAGLFGFVAGSPTIFMDGFHLSSKVFGIVFTVLVLGFIGGSQVNVFLLRKFTSQRIFFYTLLAQVVFGLIFFAGVRAHLVGLKGTLVLFFLFLSCIGLTFPNASALGLAPFSKDVGRASALLGFFQTGSGALISMGIGFLGSGSVVLLIASTTVAAFLILLIGRTQVRETVEADESEAIFMH